MKSASLAIDAVNGQLERQSRVISSLHQRASILIGASGISTALLMEEEVTLVRLTPIALFVVSIVLAVASLSFKTAAQLDPRLIMNGFENDEQEDFEGGVLEGLVRQFESVQETVPSRTNSLKLAMILFASGWVLTFLILFIQVIDSIQKAS